MKCPDTINHGVFQTFTLLLTAVFLQIREHDVLSNSANPQPVQVGEQGGVLAQLTHQFPLFSLSAHLNKRVNAFFSSDRRNSRPSQRPLPASPGQAVRDGRTGAQPLTPRPAPDQPSGNGQPGNGQGKRPGQVWDEGLGTAVGTGSIPRAGAAPSQLSSPTAPRSHWGSEGRSAGVGGH